VIKDYIYSIYNGIKISARNFSIKLEAIRQNQDQILAIKEQGSKLFNENKSLGESINSTIDSIQSYKADDISSISDIAGLKKLVGDLKETQKLAVKAIEETKAHKKNIEKLADDATKTVEKIDRDEKEKFAAALDKLAKEEKTKYENIEASDSTIAVLSELETNSERIQAEAEKKIKELEIKEKDDAADQHSDADPQNSVEECKNKKICDISSIEIVDKANRSLSYNLKTNNKPVDKDAKSEKKPPAPKTLYVIVGDKKSEEDDFEEHITIKTEGKCKTDTACPQVSFNGGSTNEEAVGTLSQIKIKSEKVIPEQSWADFLRKILVPDMNKLSRPQIYKVKAHQCDAKDKVADLKVIAIPPVGWSGSAQISYKMKDDAEKEKNC
jgi:VIT1/CCC1 family predicted Fe2+/Mn2+ transporter